MNILKTSVSLISAASLTIVAKAVAAEPELIPFRSLGYSESIVLRGVNPEMTVTIPIPPSGLDETQSFVRLNLEPSPLLNPDSSVQLLINEEPVAVIPVQALLDDPIVTLPLPQLPLSTEFVTLAVRPYLYIQRNYCEDLPTGNLFLTVGRDSFFQVTPEQDNNSIADFFRPYYSAVTLTIPPQLTDEQAEAALGLYSVLSYQFQRQNVPITWQQTGTVIALPPAETSPETSPETILAGDTLLPERPAQVVLTTRTDGPDIQRQGDTLTVKAKPEAIRALASLQNAPAVVSPTLTVNAVADAALPEVNVNTLSFDALGYEDGPRRFFGNNLLEVPFSLADLGGRPRSLTTRVRATWTPLEERLDERLTAQVYLNNTLVETYTLSNRTTLDETVVLPASQLRTYNRLAVSLSYVPAEGNCVISPTELTFQLHGDSSLSWGDYQSARGNFTDLPYAFSGNDGEVVVDSGDSNQLAAAAYLLGSLTRLIRQPLLPRLAEATASNLDVDNSRSDADVDWRLLVAAAGPDNTDDAFDPDGFNPPVRLGETFEVFNPETQQRLLSVSAGDPIGILQYFQDGDTPTLWLSWWGNDPEAATLLAATLADPRRLTADQLNGNVATYTENTRIQSWDLRQQTLDVDYPDEFKLTAFLRDYRWPLLLATAALATGVGWLVYRRLGQTPSPAALSEQNSTRR